MHQLALLSRGCVYHSSVLSPSSLVKVPLPLPITLPPPPSHSPPAIPTLPPHIAIITNPPSSTLSTTHARDFNSLPPYLSYVHGFCGGGGTLSSQPPPLIPPFSPPPPIINPTFILSHPNLSLSHHHRHPSPPESFKTARMSTFLTEFIYNEKWCQHERKE